MAIAGLGTYTNTSFYYATSNRSKSNNLGNESTFGFLPEKDSQQTNVATTSNKANVATTGVVYSRYSTANIRYEELLAAQLAHVEQNEYPDIAGAISEELSSEKITEETELKETVTPLGFGFANAGMMGYGMSAALVEKPGCDDTIIRVKLATGSGNEIIDVNLSNFDSKNATAVEMFAYCQYMDATGDGVNSKWGSWNAMKGISSPYDGCDFGSLDNIINKKMNWSDKLAKSQTNWMDPKTNEIIMSPADLIKLLEEAHKLTAKELKEEKDWRDMSDEEWDKMLEGIDKYIEGYKERLRQMKETAEEEKESLKCIATNEK